jgi:hypothetical protein
MKTYYILKVPSGTYQANNIFILLWEMTKHRLWHLLKHRKWVD